MFALPAHLPLIPTHPLAGGVEISFIVGIDFTASNGDTRDPASLHYISQNPTIYEGSMGQGVSEG